MPEEIAYHEYLDSKLNDKINKLMEPLPKFVQPFFDSLQVGGFQKRTIEQYAYDLNRFFAWVKTLKRFEHIDYSTCSASDILDELTIEDIQTYQKKYNNRTVKKDNGEKIVLNYSNARKARIASSLRAMYQYFYVDARTITSPLSEIIKVDPNKNKTKSKIDVKILESDDIEAILNAVLDTEGLSPEKIKIAKRDYAIIITLLYTGIRVSELVGIDLKDIDFKKYVKAEDAKGSIYIWRKGGYDDDVYFGDTVKAALLDYINNYRDEFFISPITHKYYVSKDKKVAEPSKEPALFVSEHQHKRMSVRSVELLVTHYKEKAGLKKAKITPHMFRRTYGTNVYEESGDLELTATALGHASTETAKKHYVRVSNKKKELAAKIAEKSIGR